MQHVNPMEDVQKADEYRVDVCLNKDEKTLTAKDNGIDINADEVHRYINQIAFFTADEFVQKFKKLEDMSQIIGHFGLGFYSSFMVAKKVEISALSYQEGTAGVNWSCDCSTNYQLSKIEKDQRSTEVVLHWTKMNLSFSSLRGFVKF